eukprot:TRINITY_DN2008_c0_g1_i22.p1 TRINITY_DN2008_c0_g1~~TRINITY_DN2008_c0_g1_i22.p1  ORF type:complete len:116 (+),score=9.77 TRINITY_DN2008_c0_g1_i22:375-722(+)
MHSNPLLSGTIPDSLGSLSGTIPDSLGILDQLVHLDMHSNPSLMLSGTVPDSLGSLEWHPTRQPRKPQPASVARAHVMHSNPLLSGTVPDSLGSLSQLVYLDMHSNPRTCTATLC